MTCKTKNNVPNNWAGKFTIIGLVFMVFALMNSSVSAQTQNCPLVISNVVGELTSFTATNFDSTTFSIVIPGNTVGVWGTLQVSSIVNTNVIVSGIPVGTKDAVYITASKIDPDQAASFDLVAIDSVGHHVTINAIVDCQVTAQGCTRTQGYWKNKPQTWQINSLTLGTVTYSKVELISILKTPVRGNGLVFLSHQLIAAKLNVAASASVPASVAAAINSADLLIGGLLVPPIGTGYLTTSQSSALNSTLDEYNNGNIPGGPRHCD